MERMEEYKALLAELSELHPGADTLERARRRRRRGMLLRPLATVAAVFALFVGLVNLSAPVAEACAGVPVLRELAQAVTFNRSLQAAVENDYAQKVNITKKQNGFTVTVEYLMVDRKQVNVFYRVTSKKYDWVETQAEFISPDGEAQGYFVLDLSAGGEPAGELWSCSVTFQEEVPPQLGMKLRIYDLSPERDYYTGGAHSPPPPAEDMWEYMESDERPHEKPLLAELDFQLEFDPYFTAQGRHIPTDAAFTVDGQTVRVSSVDVYPSHMEINVEGAAENTAWLKSLRFSLATEAGERFAAAPGGIVSFGSPDTPETVCYWAESPFFYEAESVTMEITEGEWLQKDTPATRIDLVHATAENLPQGVELLGAERRGDRWVLSLRRSHPGYYAQTFMEAHDSAGNAVEIGGWAWAAEGNGVDIESLALNDASLTEVYLTPRYTSRWTAEEPISIRIKLK